MQVTIGTSDRWGRNGDAAMPLIVDSANRQVLACAGGAGARVTGVPLDAVNEELTCGPCRASWKRTIRLPNA